MFKRLTFLFLSLVTLIPGLSQTGPAGIGTSANNVLWLKANAGTSSTTNSTAISFWNDQSGNSLNVTQTVSAQQPSIVTNFMNGYPSILFDNNSTANQNDKLIGPDSPLLDNTSAYTFFTVTRPQNLDGSARTIVSKRTGVSVDQSFMLFYYTSNKLNIDVQTTDNRFASNTTYASGTDYIGCLIYDGTVTTSGLRCSLYNEETFDKNSTETSTLVPDNASPLLIGTTDASDPRPYGGYTSEIIIYREALSTAKRIIVNNYLSAKYNISLSANDKYAGDNSGNGNYDRDVAGVGQESTGSSSSFSASVSGGLSLSVNSGLDNGDYILAGHAQATNTTITSDVGGMTGSSNARWQRVWYVDVTNGSTNLNTDLEFDMSDGGMGTFTLGTTSNYVLLYRAGQSGNWTEVTTASSISGDRIIFNSITLINDGYYTLGTRNFNVSPLPIELLSFEALYKNNEVLLNWSTASEKNNAYFTLEKSKDGLLFEAFERIKSLGNSSTRTDYSSKDSDPGSGRMYYRLKQTDTDGRFSYSNIVDADIDAEGSIRVFPNPCTGAFQLQFLHFKGEVLHLSISDVAGKIYKTQTHFVKENDELLNSPLGEDLKPGLYLLLVETNGQSYQEKILIH